MSTPKVLLIFFISFFAILQLISPERANPQSNPALEIKDNPQIIGLFKNSCYDCHSNDTKWPWYSHVAPISWIIASDVKSGREWLNFSEWDSYDEAKKEKLKKLIYREVVAAMPLYIYTTAHDSAKLNDEQKNMIRKWCSVSSGSVSTRE